MKIIISQFLPSICLFLLIQIVFWSHGFNVDTARQVRFIKGPTGSNFGFKIQAYNNEKNETMLVVSAPQLNNLVADPTSRQGRSSLVRGHGGLLICHQDEPRCNRQFFFETKRKLNPSTFKSTYF